MPAMKPGKSSTRSIVPSWPPGMPGASTIVAQPRRAAKRPAVRPATPPPITTVSNTRSAPCVDGDGLPVPRAHDAPVPIRLAADHDDVDLLASEHRDQLVRGRLQMRRQRLLAE